VRKAVFTLSLICLISLANAQERELDPADPYSASIPRVGIAHHEEMIGRFVPDVTFVATDGNEVALSSYRGRPLLIDLWATWCEPCLAVLPSLNRIYAEVKDKGMEVISFDEVRDVVDEDRDAARATKYLARHHYDWKNFHDDDRTVATALQCDGVPLALVIDGNGKIVYFDFGGNEADLRKAIAGLGPEFASVAPSDEAKADTSRDSPKKN
jgi:thiol-disulfide isomerase/thioredoxin